MAENIITEQELRDYAPDLDLSAYSATTISGMINRASKMLANFANVDGFFKAAVIGEQDRALIGSDGELVISFRRRPVVSGAVSAISLKTAGVDIELALLDGDTPRYFINTPGNVLTLPYNYLIQQGANLVYTRNAGLVYNASYIGGLATDIANLPTDLKEACTQMFRHLLVASKNPAGVKGFSQGAVSITYGDSETEDQFIKNAKSILNEGGYVRRVP